VDGANANQGGGNSQDGGAAAANNGANQNANQSNANAANQAGAVDYQKKFGESTTENQRFMDILKKNGIDPKTGERAQAQDDQGANDASGSPHFTDTDLEAAFPSYNTMTDQEKAILKQVGSLPKMARMVAEMYDKTTFNEQLAAVTANPANAIIAQNEKAFREYAYKDSNIKLPMDVLVDAFIGKKLREQGANGNQQQQTTQRQGIEQGTGAQGGNGNASAEMTAEQAREMRTKDPRKYAELARTGKLKVVN